MRRDIVRRGIKLLGIALLFNTLLTGCGAVTITEVEYDELDNISVTQVRVSRERQRINSVSESATGIAVYTKDGEDSSAKMIDVDSGNWTEVDLELADSVLLATNYEGQYWVLNDTWQLSLFSSEYQLLQAIDLSMYSEDNCRIGYRTYVVDKGGSIHIVLCNVGLMDITLKSSILVGVDTSGSLLYGEYVKYNPTFLTQNDSGEIYLLGDTTVFTLHQPYNLSEAYSLEERCLGITFGLGYELCVYDTTALYGITSGNELVEIVRWDTLGISFIPSVVAMDDNRIAIFYGRTIYILDMMS